MPLSPRTPDHRQTCDRIAAFLVLTALGQRNREALEKAVEIYATGRATTDYQRDKERQAAEFRAIIAMAKLQAARRP